VPYGIICLDKLDRGRKPSVGTTDGWPGQGRGWIKSEVVLLGRRAIVRYARGRQQGPVVDARPEGENRRAGE